jgi:iron complex transport system substrate-binding protein
MKSNFKNIFIIILAIFTVFSLTACSNKEETPIEETAIENTVENTPEKEEMRTIVDLAGNEVSLPGAEELNKVIIVAPPLMATFANVVGDTEKLVGVHPSCIRSANEELLNTVVPNWKDINTSFLKGFKSNAEEVLKMDPDIILVYGDFQKEGLENIKVPIIDFYIEDTENETWSVKIDTLMREIFEIEGTNTLQKEWDDANEIVNSALSNISEENKKRGIMIRNNSNESFSARGKDYYGDDWLIKTGLTNVAGELKGDSAEISMEQLYNWNPEVVYDFVGADADVYLENSIEGRDWSKIDAFKNKQIYDTPIGMFNWGAPNVDSPLTLIWMTMKNYPELIDEEFFNSYMKDFYKRQYDIDLSDDLMNSILNPNK